MPTATSTTHTFPLTPPQAVATTSAEVWTSDRDGRPALVLAHGAGTDRSHPQLRSVARRLAARGHPVALFNFAYTEAGRRRPDPAARLEQAWRDAVAALRPLLGEDRPLVVGGRSMGGRIATMVAAAGAPVDGCVTLAYPLHPPGRPDRLRVAHWPDLRVPWLLLSGDRDDMAPLATLRAELARHLPDRDVTLHVLAGADHSYRVRKADGRTAAEVLDEVVDVTAGWLAARWPAAA